MKLKVFITASGILKPTPATESNLRTNFIRSYVGNSRNETRAYIHN